MIREAWFEFFDLPVNKLQHYNHVTFGFCSKLIEPFQDDVAWLIIYFYIIVNSILRKHRKAKINTQGKMTLQQKIIAARKNKGLTQEELADLTKITPRTIQRIESGESVPRNFTLKAIAVALDIPFENLISTEVESKDNVAELSNDLISEKDNVEHFLRMLCLSCFSYIILPYVHFLIPAYFVKKNDKLSPNSLLFSQRLIRTQVYWMVTTIFVFLIVLAYNLYFVRKLGFSSPVNYLVPFFIMYFINAVIILINLKQVQSVSHT